MAHVAHKARLGTKNHCNTASTHTHPFAPRTCHSWRCGRPSRLRWMPWLQARWVEGSWWWSTSRPWDRGCPLTSIYMHPSPLLHQPTRRHPPLPDLAWRLLFFIWLIICLLMQPFQDGVKCRASAAEDMLVNNWRATSLCESVAGFNTAALSCKGGDKGWGSLKAVTQLSPFLSPLFVPGMKTSCKAPFDSDNLSWSACTHQWEKGLPTSLSGAFIHITWSSPVERVCPVLVMGVDLLLGSYYNL